jgi:hypothetical protein
VHYYPHFACDPSKSLTGTRSDAEWTSNTSYTNQRFHVDLGAPVLIQRIYYENSHSSGSSTNFGAKNFVLYGSNVSTAFDELTYGTDTNWNIISTNVTQFAQHAASDSSDPHYVYVTSPPVPYRYYAFKIADNWGSYTCMGIRHIALQTMR